jgi:hypothetical protein
MYNKVIVITDMKYIPITVLVELARLYKYVCVRYFKSVGGIKATIDVACINNGMLEPAPIYAYTSKELRTQAKRNLTMYFNGLGVDIVFKVHV